MKTESASRTIEVAARFFVWTLVRTFTRADQGNQVFDIDFPQDGAMDSSQQFVDLLRNRSVACGSPRASAEDCLRQWPPEFLSLALAVWAQDRGIEPDYIEPGKPIQNCFVESFNGMFRDDRFNENLFAECRRRSGPGGRATTRNDFTAH
jgi:transposase InsO family protein